MHRHHTPRLKNRKGFALILMAGMGTVLIGAGAFAVDFGSMYRYRAQLNSTADAAALAAIVAYSNGAASRSADSAVAYAAKNAVGSSTNTLATADVLPGSWTGSAFQNTTIPNDWSDANLTAVQVTTRFTGSYTFGRVFGFSTRALTATATAVRGSLGKTACVRPWAVSYQDMLDILYTPGSKAATSYNLTSGDVTSLTTQGPTHVIKLNEPGSGEGAPHQMRAVQLPGGEFADGTAGNPWGNSGAQYKSAISESCAQLAIDMGTHTTVGVDDWLQTVPGQKVGNTRAGVDALCGGSDTCSQAVTVNVALWDSYGNAPQGHCSGCYHVKYMGLFNITGYDQGTNSVMGYFSSTAQPSGGFVNKPGPLPKNALVK